MRGSHGGRMSEVSRDVTIRNRHGLHARPAAAFVRVASGFRSEIMVRKDDLEVNGKSIMGVLMLAAEPGAVLTIRAAGEDASEAVDALVELVTTDRGDVDELEDLAVAEDDEP
jgi:phosphocarrier protein HPr